MAASAARIVSPHQQAGFSVVHDLVNPAAASSPNSASRLFVDLIPMFPLLIARSAAQKLTSIATTCLHFGGISVHEGPGKR
jgi:hypothetical protein